jgi:CO/xanthine dehydrogenase Mo-binding subunit
VHCAAAEVGQGVSNVVLQVACTELGTDRVRLAPGSTASVASSGSASASRMTWMAAGAVRDACRAALAEHERTGGEVDVERIYRHPPTKALDPETGQITGGPAHVALACAAMKVVVEVDVDLGLDTAVGLDRNCAGRREGAQPAGGRGADRGGTAQGLGSALMEEIQTRDGVITNASFTDYLIPTALDVPPIVSSSSRTRARRALTA